MKFGLSGCAGGFDSANPDETLSLSVTAEKLGFAGIWINEEHFQQGERPRKCLSPLILGTAIAARTSKIRIGFSVLLMGLHNRVRLAEDIRSMDLLSKGRIDFGISRGNSTKYLQAYNIDSSQASQERFHESINFLISCWKGEEFVANGQKFLIEKTFQQPHPPIYIGTYTEDTARWAAEEGHLLIQHGIQSMTSMKRILSAYESGGRDVSKVPVGRFLYVGKDDSSARKVAWPAACKLAEYFRKSGMQKHGILTEKDLEPERFYHEMLVAGSPTTCVEQLKSLREYLGVDYVNFLSGMFGYLAPQEIQESLHRTSREIMPVLRDRK